MIKGLPYTGGKYGIIDQLLPHLIRPEFEYFYDMMCGGGTVAANVPYQNLVLNDIQSELIQILQITRLWGSEFSVEVLDGIINDDGFKRAYIEDTGHFRNVKDFTLSSTNKDAYLLLREIYNRRFKDPYVLLTLIYHSYNNMIRFNKKGGFNVPFGGRTFNDQARADFIAFVDSLYGREQVLFTSASIGAWDYNKEPRNSLFYFDPPYLISNASYNDGWRQQQDAALMNMLDEFHKNSISWALSNVFANNGRINEKLIEWASQYDVIYIDNNYDRSYVNRKGGDGKTVEVLIKNYV